MNQAYLKHARNELTEYYVYRALAKREKKAANRELLEKLSDQEKSHYEFWQSLLPGIEVKPYRLSLRGIPLLRTFLGVTFTTKFLEAHEHRAVAMYTRLLPSMPPNHQERLQQIIEDEKTHEQSLIEKLHEKRILYLGAVALGIADAIVEITGVHAGFLGVTGSTTVAGASGLIVGFAAAISMGSASYIQAKQEKNKSAIISALVTGFSYLGSVVLLALPYFMIHTMIPAFLASTLVGMILLAAFTFFGAVVFDRKFSREFGEAASLMIITAIATYFLGEIIGKFFDIGSGNFGQ